MTNKPAINLLSNKWRINYSPKGSSSDSLVYDVYLLNNFNMITQINVTNESETVMKSKEKNITYSSSVSPFRSVSFSLKIDYSIYIEELSKINNSTDFMDINILIEELRVKLNEQGFTLGSLSEVKDLKEFKGVFDVFLLNHLHYKREIIVDIEGLVFENIKNYQEKKEFLTYFSNRVFVLFNPYPYPVNIGLEIKAEKDELKIPSSNINYLGEALKEYDVIERSNGNFNNYNQIEINEKGVWISYSFKNIYNLTKPFLVPGLNPIILKTNTSSDAHSYLTLPVGVERLSWGGLL